MSVDNSTSGHFTGGSAQAARNSRWKFHTRDKTTGTGASANGGHVKMSVNDSVSGHFTSGIKGTRNAKGHDANRDEPYTPSPRGVRARGAPARYTSKGPAVRKGFNKGIAARRAGESSATNKTTRVKKIDPIAKFMGERQKKSLADYWGPGGPPIGKPIFGKKEVIGSKTDAAADVLRRIARWKAKED